MQAWPHGTTLTACHIGHSQMVRDGSQQFAHNSAKFVQSSNRVRTKFVQSSWKFSQIRRKDVYNTAKVRQSSPKFPGAARASIFDMDHRAQTRNAHACATGPHISEAKPQATKTLRQGMELVWPVNWLTGLTGNNCSYLLGNCN